MSILVVCTGCKKSFQVNDKFAGKSGPCPKCKTVIRIPDKAQEVKVHAPEEFGGGGRGVSGQLALKPIARTPLKVRPVMAAAVAGSVLAVLIVTWLAGGLLQQSLMARAIGLLAISPALAVAAYTFLRDDELEPYRGLPLYYRAAACATGYAVLWGLFWYVKTTMAPTTTEPLELWQWLFLAPPFLGLGTLAAWVAFDLEIGNAFFHYAFYLLVTIFLGWVAGLGWVWT
jgi:hypothetical protein